MGLLVGAKLLSVGVPFLFKAAVDALAFDPTGLSAAPVSATSGSLPPPLSTWLPTSLLLGYGAARAGAAAAGEARNAVFAAIT
jgi:ABC transporter ATM